MEHLHRKTREFLMLHGGPAMPVGKVVKKPHLPLRHVAIEEADRLPVPGMFEDGQEQIRDQLVLPAQIRVCQQQRPIFPEPLRQ